jgi:hypothetical protein
MPEMKATHKAARVRPRIQRAFLRWLVESQSRLAVPIWITKRMDQCLCWSFAGVNPIVHASLTWEIAIWVDWQGQNWDYLEAFEPYPKAVSGGYVCHMCYPEAQKLYPSREALWLDHTFEPFLEWVNGKLVKAKWIGLYATENKGCTWGKLLSDLSGHGKENASESVVVPLWTNAMGFVRSGG